MSAAAVIWHRQQKIIRRFRDARATNPQNAHSLEDLSMRTNWIFRHMARKGVFVAVRPDHWYLDLAALQRFESRQWRRFLTFIGVFAVAFIVLLLLFG